MWPILLLNAVYFTSIKEQAKRKHFFMLKKNKNPKPVGGDCKMPLSVTFKTGHVDAGAATLAGSLRSDGIID